MLRLPLLIASLSMILPVWADTTGEGSQEKAQEVLALWGSQGGPWTGRIDIYGPDASGPQTVGLKTKWDAVPDHSILTKIETFSGPTGETSAVTLMFADPLDGDIVTPYFMKGQQRDYHFAVISVSVADPTHWTTVIASPDGQEEYEGRPAELRYVRTRNGDVIENTKEVRFLDIADGAEGAGGKVKGERSAVYELRSFIRQTLTSSP